MNGCEGCGLRGCLFGDLAFLQTLSASLLFVRDKLSAPVRSDEFTLKVSIWVWSVDLSSAFEALLNEWMRRANEWPCVVGQWVRRALVRLFRGHRAFFCFSIELYSPLFVATACSYNGGGFLPLLRFGSISKLSSPGTLSARTYSVYGSSDFYRGLSWLFARTTFKASVIPPRLSSIFYLSSFWTYYRRLAANYVRIWQIKWAWKPLKPFVKCRDRFKSLPPIHRWCMGCHACVVDLLAVLALNCL